MKLVSRIVVCVVFGLCVLVGVCPVGTAHAQPAANMKVLLSQITSSGGSVGVRKVGCIVVGLGSNVACVDYIPLAERKSRKLLSRNALVKLYIQHTERDNTCFMTIVPVNEKDEVIKLTDHGCSGVPSLRGDARASRADKRLYAEGVRQMCGAACEGINKWRPKLVPAQVRGKVHRAPSGVRRIAIKFARPQAMAVRYEPAGDAWPW